MFGWQDAILLFNFIASAIITVKSSIESSQKKHAFQETPWLLPWGIFVWADGVVFGVFWLLVSIVCLLLSDWMLFLLVYSLFWVVRSMGETIYWLHEQFATHHRNDPKNLRGYSIVKNDSVYFLYQIVWQCVTIVSIVLSIYFAALWIRSL